MATSTLQLSRELKALQKEPVEGFQVFLPDEGAITTWHVTIFGPPDTLYQGGCFMAKLLFPKDYPYSPPKFSFLTKFTHPNVYEDGELCISILHPPGEDPVSGELPSERWNPTQSVRTILLSAISLLNEPNISSPANVDASVQYRKWIDSGEKEYESTIRQEVENSRLEAEKNGIKFPTTPEEYCQTAAKQTPDLDSQNDLDDYCEDSLDYEYDVDSEEEDEFAENDEERDHSD